MPGTGKTATTLEVINTLRQKKIHFSFLHINAMSLTNPNLVYTIIYESITGRRVAPASAALFLDEFFKKKDKTKILASEMNRGKNKQSSKEISKVADKMRVILVDELDALVTKK
jgi:Cdc6-like AAA superfamily ATPase